MPWERRDDSASPAGRTSVRKGVTRSPQRRENVPGKQPLDGEGADRISRPSPSEMDAKRRLEMSKIEPTTDLSKSELIALVLAARSADIGDEIKESRAHFTDSKASTNINSNATPSRDGAAGAEADAMAALRAENAALKTEVKALEDKLKHESAVSRQLCVQVSRMKVENKQLADTLKETSKE
eukprot:g1184.t1